MTPMPPELRRIVAIAMLRSCLGREPRPVEVAQALCHSGQISDAAALGHHVAQWLSRRVNTERAAWTTERATGATERAALKVELETAQASLREVATQLEAMADQLSRLRASTSWRLTRPIRAVAGLIPARSLKTIRKTVGGTLRHLRSPVATPAPAPSRLPFGVGSNPYDNAAVWCMRDPPAVSIIILNHDDVGQTIDCLHQVWACTTGVPYEIVIADNGSDTPDLQRLDGIGNGVRVIRIGTDRFFGEANNIAAEAARGDFICLLHNGVLVGEGWLASLLAAIRDDSSIGAAAPRFVDAMPVTGRPEVDFASADALLVDLSVFNEVGGFDLSYEPGSLADVDLCYKLRLIGRSIKYCPNVAVSRFHSGRRKRAGAARGHAIEEVNRAKLLARWGGWPGASSAAVVEGLRREVIPAATTRQPENGMLPRAAIFTPYLLTPGGGERVIMTLASVLSRTHAVEIVTIYPYSRLRLANMGQEFSLDLSRCTLGTYEQYRQKARPDVWVTLGNHLFPPVPGGGRRNWYICQFPFPMDKGTLVSSRDELTGYNLVLTYSEYALAHVNSGLRSERIHDVRTEVLYPPVVLPAGDAAAKRPMILTVGRFIARGHTKRHDAMIDAFRSLYNRCGGSIEFHIVGSSFPTDGDMEYLTELKAAAADIPVTFHVNANKEKLAALYREAMFYWHATGYGSDTSHAPERAEHFGISIVEAMAAECVPLAFAAGGPCEIIRNTRTGFLFESLDELVDVTASLLEPDRSHERQSIAKAAADAARRFSLDAFQERVEQLVDPRLASVAP
jgi:glycosyltransferase involved in cell wall biosynthesis/GT2 family glycosyltransferase